MMHADEQFRLGRLRAVIRPRHPPILGQDPACVFSPAAFRGAGVPKPRQIFGVSQEFALSFRSRLLGWDDESTNEAGCEPRKALRWRARLKLKHCCAVRHAIGR